MTRGSSLVVVIVAVALVGVVAGVELGQVHVGPAPHLPVWSALPFGLLLLCVAVLPLVAQHWWEDNRNKALVSGAFALLVAAYLIALAPATGGETTNRLLHELAEYASFILMLASLYTVAGGIVITGGVRGRPVANAAILFTGAVLANVIGTTGASILLIHPFLRINADRQRVRHLPIFFIFMVSNTGGLLTPLGDPPLFLGFLKGVDFFWTLSLWREWLLVNSLIVLIFFAWDTVAYRREAKSESAPGSAESLAVRGLWPNLPLLAGIVAAVLLQSETTGRALGRLVPGSPDLTLHKPWGEAVLALMLLLSLAITPRELRTRNSFSWGPIVEVAALFVGIFVTMVPALALLERHGPRFGVSEPWQYFWLTGVLSSFLDNAPTYLTFATLAAGGEHVGVLTTMHPMVLRAISCGAVFMGANTYIGNGPNFMVKAIAEQMKYKMPSFFGYLAWSTCVLLPIFGLVTWVFF